MPRSDSKIWHPEDIKAAVRKRGATLVSVALEAGLPRHCCMHALRFPHTCGEAAIAQFLGKEVTEIWPHRFHPDGTRRHKIRRHWKSSGPADARHRENQEAA
ncbi:MAG: transcriptional regulator [Rhodospirillaceae bacterium]|nr:MAG: transcriptional regulator [Rhodospirillaceae bacterium]